MEEAEREKRARASTNQNSATDIKRKLENNIDRTRNKKMSDEKVLDRKYDACMARLLVNSGIGASAGIILSVVLFRRRFWPIPFSVGFAAGTIYLFSLI